jgi:hypothetical protein
MVYFNLLVAGLFICLMALGYAYFLTTGKAARRRPRGSGGMKEGEARPAR